MAVIIEQLEVDILPPPSGDQSTAANAPDPLSQLSQSMAERDRLDRATVD